MFSPPNPLRNYLSEFEVCIAMTLDKGQTPSKEIEICNI